MRLLLLASAGSVLLLAVAVFCGFGFLATFEPTDNPRQFLAFRVGYAMVGLGCLFGVILLLVGAWRRR